MATQIIGMITMLIKWKLFNLLNLFVNGFNFLIIKLYRARKVQVVYANSARVYNIKLRYKPSPMMPANVDCFIPIVEKLAHPEIVLKDGITLFCINTKEAVFVDCGGEDAFDSSHNAFVYNTQYALARKIICLPLQSFHEVSSKIQIPNIPMVHLANHGRCGSTLLTKLIEEMPGSLSVSETTVFTDIAMLSQKGVVEREEAKKMCYSALMCTIKHCNTRNSQLLFLKFQHLVTYITDMMIEVFPEMKHVYMYRQPVPFVRSWEKLLFANNWTLGEDMWMLAAGFGNYEILQGYPTYNLGYMKRLSTFAKIGLIWVTGVAVFNKLISKGYPITSLKYEEMVSNPKEAMLSIFSYLNIDETLLPDIETVMSKDSQEGSDFTSRNVDKKQMESSLTAITEELKGEMNKICGDFKAPLFWDQIHLKKSILCNGFQ